MTHKTITIELSELEARALRASIQWTLELDKSGKLELYDWQYQALKKLSDIGYPEGQPSAIDSKAK